MWSPAAPGGLGEGTAGPGRCTGCPPDAAVVPREASFLAVSGVHSFVAESRLQAMCFESPGAAPAGCRRDLRPSNKCCSFGVSRHVPSPRHSLSHSPVSLLPRGSPPGWEAPAPALTGPSAAVR